MDLPVFAIELNSEAESVSHVLMNGQELPGVTDVKIQHAVGQGLPTVTITFMAERVEGLPKK